MGISIHPRRAKSELFNITILIPTILTRRRLYINVIERDGTTRKLAVAEGDNLMEVCQYHDIEMEGKSPRTHIPILNRHVCSP